MERGWCVHRSEWNWTAFVKIDVRFPIGDEKLRLYSTIDWQAESDRVASSSATYR